MHDCVGQKRGAAGHVLGPQEAHSVGGLPGPRHGAVPADAQSRSVLVLHVWVAGGTGD